MSDLRSYFGPNAGYVLELYDRYVRDPQSVDPQSRAFFERWNPTEEAVPAGAVAASRGETSTADLSLAVRAAALAEAIRREGHVSAHLDPLAGPPAATPGPSAADFGLTSEDIARLPASIIDGAEAFGARTAAQAIGALRKIYCGTAGFEIDHLQDPAARTWLRSAIESGRFRVRLDGGEKQALLERLTQVGSFERFLHQAYPGRTRFSIEGNGMLVPMLDALIQSAAEDGAGTVLVGMAHRGRLNVMAHIFGQSYEEVITEFLESEQTERSGYSTDPDGLSGDVRYHGGGRTTYTVGGRELTAILSVNPSHLEHVNPVVQGMARAAQDDRSHAGAPTQREDEAIAVFIHGDAAFPGQGVVAETLNMARLEGYGVAGAFHIIVNNQLGFTTEPRDARSTRFSSDLARGFGMPIIRVNADDPIACLSVMKLAWAFRHQFHLDVVIDLIGYRRWGHNEGDEPALTQPAQYQKIATHPTVREQLASQLDREGVVPLATAETMLRTAIGRLQEARSIARQAMAESGAVAGSSAEPSTRPVAAGVPEATLTALNQAMAQLPEGFSLHSRLDRPWQRRIEGLTLEGTIDWGHAEALAFASILADGTPIRLSGQDSERGTYSHRHAVVHNPSTGARHNPLQALPAARASFGVYNSPLSESGVVGFDYGYSVQAPETMVIWEAQYGDFVNGAQAMIDEFLVSDWAKWRQRSSITMLLPHGYEGQGPDHSSGRVERFLQMAAHNNLWVANCSTPAQYFHLLRRHAALLRTDPRPLICLTPKSLLRLPEAASKAADLVHGSFQTVIDDEAARNRAKSVRRVVLCSGKVYYDLLAADKRRTAPIAYIRVEQFYPFPDVELGQILAGYPGVQEVAWVQEEPENMGAWRFAERYVRSAAGSIPVIYIGRAASGSPAEGTPRRHTIEQARIVAETINGASTAPLRNVGVRHAR